MPAVEIRENGDASIRFQDNDKTIGAFKNVLNTANIPFSQRGENGYTWIVIEQKYRSEVEMMALRAGETLVEIYRRI